MTDLLMDGKKTMKAGAAIKKVILKDIVSDGIKTTMIKADTSIIIMEA